MNEKVIQLTRSEYEEKQAKLINLKTIEREKNIQDIKEAKSHGDLSENAEYDAAREKQGEIAAAIDELEAQLKNAVIIEDEDISTDKVGIGSVVRFVDKTSNREMEYQMHPAASANLARKQISEDSPIGKALMGHAVGETVTADTPGGVRNLEILEIKKPEKKDEEA